MPGLPEPVKVSPLIKFFRYSFLIAGIIYGATRNKALQIKEAGMKEEKERRKAERDKRIAAEKKAANERDIAEIVAIFIPKTDPKFVGEGSYNESNASEEYAKAIDGETCSLNKDDMNSLINSKNSDSTAGNVEECRNISNIGDFAIDENGIHRGFIDDNNTDGNSNRSIYEDEINGEFRASE